MYAQQSRARCHPRHSLVLLCVLVLSGSAQAAIGDKASKKALPERSAYWEAKLGLAALTEGPVVDVLLPADALAQKDVGVLARYVGAPAPVAGGGHAIETRMSILAAKALVQRGVTVTPMARDAAPVPRAAPANDHCADAAPAEVDITYVGTTDEAVDADVWYAFSPPTSGPYLIDLGGSSFDTILFVYFGGCRGALLDSDDDGGPGSTSALVMDLEAGETYYIRITGFLGTTGQYSLRISAADPSVPGQSCVVAIPIGLGETLTGKTSNEMEEAWFSYTAETDGFYRFSTAGSDYDTLLRAYDGCGGAVLAANDDEGLESTSALAFYATGGETYYVQISGFLGSTGDYSLAATAYTPVPGEFRQLAIPVEPRRGRVYRGNTTTLIEGQAWYQYTPSTTGPVVISLLGSDFDTVLRVRDESDRFLLGFNDNVFEYNLFLSGVPFDPLFLQSRLSMHMTAGQTYLIVVAGWGGFYTGPYSLQLTPIESPPHDTVATPATARLDVVTTGSTDGATSTLQMSRCGFFDSLDVWYAFVPTETGFIEVGVEGKDFNPTLALFDAQEGREMACCEDRTFCTFDPTVVSQVTGGREYLIRVAGYNLTTGNFTMTLRQLGGGAPQFLTAPQPQPGGEVAAQPEIQLSWNDGGQAVQTSPLGKAPARARGEYRLKTVYGVDDRRDEYEVEDPDHLRLGDATAVLVDVENLSLDPDGLHYQLVGPALHEIVSNLCADEPYFNQPTPGFCSGFLVAPDLLATAGHCTGCDGDLRRIAVVFGFVMVDAETPTLAIPVTEVYFIDEVVASQWQFPDWGLLRLDRPVPNHLPLPLRRAGRVAERQPLVVIGYPLGLPRKYDSEGTVQDNWLDNSFGANLDTTGGNSGSAVFNGDTLEVEGMLVAGPFVDFLPFDIFDGSPVPCRRMGNCPDAGCPALEVITRITLMSGLIPSYDVLLGTTPQNLSVVRRNCPGPTCRLSGLASGQTYYWQVVKHTAAGQVSGPIWSFKVRP
ncbi:MAG: trypsin-like peptidase domain-containing protein [Planctomycetes bacterium]|nr:trypsin-like peptidase domain-containing protein [Planctomycetota bacterium]